MNLSVVVVAVSLAGCTSNPWFYIESDSGMSDSSGDGSSSGGVSSQPTGDPETSGVPTSDGGGTTQVEDTTTGGDPSTTSGPGTSVGGTTTGGTTTVDPDSGVDTSESGVIGECGNGVVEGGEACDHGEDNADDGECLSSCALASCGDGFLFKDVEQCDDGNENSNDGCLNTCVHAICGDGIVQEGQEECDEGPNNSELGECTEQCKATFCGDAIAQEDEACDEGQQNGMGVGKCSPDCAVVIQQKLIIQVTANGINGLLMKNGSVGIEGADKLCQGFGVNYKAMISDGQERIASQTPWLGDGVGWVLHPYTAYVTPGQALIGVTTNTRLLGKPGVGDLVNPIGANGLVWTGMKDDWTSADGNCDGWMSAAPLNEGVVGEASDKQSNYLQAEGLEASCAESRRLYCAQQPG